MNKLLASLIAGAVAVASSAVMAQTPAPTPTPAPTAPAKPKLTEKELQDLSRNSTNPAQAKANVDASKMDPRVKPPKYDEKTAQSLSDNSATNPAQQKANVAASKAQSPTRVKMPDIKSMTPAERAELRRELDKLSTP